MPLRCECQSPADFICRKVGLDDRFISLPNELFYSILTKMSSASQYVSNSAPF